MIKQFTTLLTALTLFSVTACDPADRTPGGPDTVGIELTPAVAPTAAVVPTPTILRRSGQMATQPVTPPSPISVVSVGHSGSGIFIVKALIGTRENVLINTIGAYQGQRPLFTQLPVTFDIQADGSWMLTIDIVPRVPSPVFQGRGDAVSGIFEAPAAGAWDITHDGQRNFSVYLYCTGSSSLIHSMIGPTSGSRAITFPQGPCVWEVQADGAWSLRPQQ